MVRTKTAGIRCIQWKWGRTKGKRRRRFCTLFFQPSLWCHTRHRLRRREAINDLNNNAALCIPCHTLACLPLRGLSHTVSASTAYLPHAATPSCSCPPVSSLTLSNPFLPLSLSHILSIVLPTSRSLSLPDCVTHMMPSLLVNTLCPYLTLSLHSLSCSSWSGRAGSPAQF